MKTITSLFFIFFTFVYASFCQNSTLVFTRSWSESFPSKMSFDRNLGIASFSVEESNLFLLSEAEKTVEKYHDGVLAASFEASGVLDISSVDDNVYMLFPEEVRVIDKNGNKGNSFPIAPEIQKYVDRIEVESEKLYVMLCDGSTQMYTADGNSRMQGWYLKDGVWASSERLNSNSFRVNIYKNNVLFSSRVFKTEKKIGSVKLVGGTDGYLVVDAEFIETEKPLLVDRKVMIIGLLDGYTGSLTREISIPNAYYTYSRKDLLVRDNTLYYLSSTTGGVAVYGLPINENLNARPFPESLYTDKVHFNQYLLMAPMEEDVDESHLKTKAPISRAQIIANAEPYDTHVWTCSAANIKDYDCGGEHVTTPSWVQVGTNVSVPYMWGGWSSLSGFDQGILNGVSAGDSYTTGGGAGSACAVGVDCSGFVSRAWELPTKYGTWTLPNISTEYASFTELKPGDIVNYAGSHVRIVHTVNLDGSFLMIEASASATNWSVGYSTYTVADLQASYLPRYYNDVINVPTDTTSPETEIVSNSWVSEDFTALFNDTDNEAVSAGYVNVSFFDGLEWRGDHSSGYLFDDFQDGLIHPEWSIIDGDWAEANGTLRQSNEALSNNNVYSMVDQNQSDEILYHWKMKISGAGTNRRGGIYFFSDDPLLDQRNNSYMVYLRADQNTCQIYKSTANSIVLQTTDPCIVNADTWYDCKVIFNPGSGLIRVFQDDVLVSEWTDPVPHTSGNAISLRTGNCVIDYDDFSVYRKRTSSTTISVGSGMNLPYQNLSPTQPAGIIRSIAVDESLNFSNIVEKHVNVDWTPPGEIDYVWDGIGQDEDTTSDNTTLFSNWATSYDGNSLVAYYCTLGTTPGGNEVADWFNTLGSVNSELSSLSLSTGLYYFSVKAINEAGLESSIVSSDGIYVDPFLNRHFLSKIETEIYPNPASDYIFIPEVIHEGASYSLISADGRVVCKGEVNSDNVIYLNKISGGIFILQLEDGKRIIRKKIIIDK